MTCALYIARVFWWGLAFAFLITLLGCGYSRQSRAVTAESVVNAHQSTITRSLEGQTIPNVTVSGSSNVVTVAPVPMLARVDIEEDSNTRGQSTGDFASASKFSLSTWVAVAAAAVCVALLLFVWVLWSKLSATGAAADRGFAAGIDMLSSLTAQSTDAETISALTSVRADLEKRRGQVKR